MEEREITRLLGAVRDGDRDAFDRLFALVYQELHRRAHHHLRQAGEGTLVTTALVHEAYVKLAGSSARDWDGRRHFYRVAARAMRQIVVDRARRRRADKRGGGQVALDIDRVPVAAAEASSDRLLALEEAIGRLEAESPRAAQVVELTWFVGLSVEEAADVMDVSVRTVKRLRQFARAFLHRDLDGDATVQAPAAG